MQMLTNYEQKNGTYTSQLQSRGIYPLETQWYQCLKKARVAQPEIPERGLKLFSSASGEDIVKRCAT